MQKSLASKGFVLGIIVLFVGASVVPSITGYDRDVERRDRQPERSRAFFAVGA